MAANLSSLKSSLVQKLMTTVILVAAFLLSAGMVLYLALKGKEVAVPNLVGKSEGEAEKLLAAEGLRLRIRNRTTDEKIQANLISDQLPNPGTNVKAGQGVSVTVSTGIEAKKEEATATPRPTAKPKPKPKPKPSPKDDTGSEKDGAAKRPDGAKGKDSGKDEADKLKSAHPPVPKTSPKATPKPSPKKPDIN